MQRLSKAAAIAVLSMLVAAPMAVVSPAEAQTGMASYYKSGKVTANGERFNPHGLTAAHRSLPFGTKVKVVNVRSGKSVVVRINDRGPFIRGRIIDLSLGAAQKIGLHQSGVAKVSLQVLR
jgi:rare lipoprotein A